jgi:predicted phosphodiesterase
MRIAIISDIHGNLEALLRVLDDAAQVGADQIISLGDNIGYGPEPEEVVALLRRRGIASIMGNHEQALTSPSYLERLNPTARESMRITRTLLSPATASYCMGLPTFQLEGGARLVHGCPPDSPGTYLFDPPPARIRRLFNLFAEPLCFFGHTHLLLLYEWDGTVSRTIDLQEGDYLLDPEHRYLVNVGSVGQPRDGTSHAKYLVWDQARAMLTVRFVRYEVAITAEKIIALGFPAVNARRLGWQGGP